jgi:hypothetical protein
MDARRLARDGGRLRARQCVVAAPFSGETANSFDDSPSTTESKPWVFVLKPVFTNPGETAFAVSFVPADAKPAVSVVVWTLAKPRRVTS